MDKKEYKAGIKKLKEEQKESKSQYKSERIPRKEVAKTAITKAGKKVFRTREEVIKIKHRFNSFLTSLREAVNSEYDIDLREEIKTILNKIENV